MSGPEQVQIYLVNLAYMFDPPSLLALSLYLGYDFFFVIGVMIVTPSTAVFLVMCIDLSLLPHQRSFDVLSRALARDIIRVLEFSRPKLGFGGRKGHTLCPLGLVCYADPQAKSLSRRQLKSLNYLYPFSFFFFFFLFLQYDVTKNP